MPMVFRDGMCFARYALDEGYQMVRWDPDAVTSTQARILFDAQNLCWFESTELIR